MDANQVTFIVGTAGDAAPQARDAISAAEAAAIISVGSGVSQIIAGTNITITPSGGTGAVTVNAGGGTGTVTQHTSAASISGTPPDTLTDTGFGVTVTGTGGGAVANFVGSLGYSRGGGDPVAQINLALSIDGTIVSQFRMSTIPNFTGTVPVALAGGVAALASGARIVELFWACSPSIPLTLSGAADRPNNVTVTTF